MLNSAYYHIKSLFFKKPWKLVIIPCLSPFWLLLQNTTHWVLYKQQKFISHSSGSWGVQDQSTRSVRYSSHVKAGNQALVRTFFWVQSRQLLATPSQGGREQGISLEDTLV